MTTHVLLHFEDKNDVTIITKLHRATHMWLVALYKSLTMIVTSFLCSKCKRTWVFMEIVCFIANLMKLRNCEISSSNLQKL